MPNLNSRQKYVLAGVLGCNRRRSDRGDCNESHSQDDVQNDGWDDDKYDANEGKRREFSGDMTEDDAELR